MSTKGMVALAVGTALAAPALGQGSVQVYGKVYPQFAQMRTTGATAPGSLVSTLTQTGNGTGILPATGTNGQNQKPRFSVDALNSRVGFRGDEKLGGVRAIWQIEQAVAIDSGDGDPWANRNSFVGLTGGWGTVKLGNMDTIYKEYGDNFALLGIATGNFVSASSVLSHNGFGTNRAGRFHERRPNSVVYETPEIGDFQLGIQYSPDETKGNPGQPRNGDWWSLGMKYELERLYASVQHEIHNDTFGASNNLPAVLSNLASPANPDSRSKDTATRFTVEFKPGFHRFTGDFAMLKYRESGQIPGVAKFSRYKHNTWAVGWEARWGGPWRTAVQLTRAGEGSCELTIGDCSTEGLEGTMLAAGVAYNFSRRTYLFVIGARLNNGTSAVYDNITNGVPTPGADSTQVALGLNMNF